MPAKLVFDNLTNELIYPEEMLSDGKTQSHHFQGSIYENLCELAGRVCYDSAAKKNTRGSKEYFDHIKEANHTSILEHANFQINLSFNDQEEAYAEKGHILCSLVGRPGVYFTGCPTWTECCVSWNMNLRSILEWNQWRDYGTGGRILGSLLHRAAKDQKIAPYLFDKIEIENIDKYPIKMSLGISDCADWNNGGEIWASFYIYGVSRGLSHELVRHGDFTAISQRSTRYVDESESDWSWHPLMTTLEKLPGNDIGSRMYAAEDAAETCRAYYKTVAEELKDLLIERGVDKFTALKQARGAARGVLGNALSTELIFSANLDQWKRMLRQRASDAADAEIRLLFNDIFPVLKEKFPNHFEKWTTTPASDGIGFAVKET